MAQDGKRIVWENEDYRPFPVKPFKSEEFGNGILVRGSNWLGDAVMTFPALKALRSVLPPFCALFVLTPKGLAPLYRALKGTVDVVLTLENAHAFPTFQERNAIRLQHAKVGLLFNNSFRDTLALRLAGVPNLCGAKARFRSLLLKRAWPFPKRRDFVLNHPHQAAKYLAMAYALGAEKWDGVMPEITPAVTLETVREDLQPILRNPHLLTIAAGAAYGDAKRWDEISFRQVAAAWLQQHPDGCVVTVGSKKEADIAAKVVQDLPADKLFNLAGKTSLDELMLLLRQSRFCVANDSGVMHLSAAMDRPGVAVFGSTDAVATAPISTKWTILYDKMDCSPCFRRICPRGTKECMRKITPEDVIALFPEKD